jgi:anoctamin-10
MYAFLSGSWAVLALELWKRRQSTLVMRFGMSQAPAVQPLRPQFKEAGRVTRAKDTGELTYASNPTGQSLRMAVSVCATLTAMGGAIAVVTAIFVLRLYLMTQYGNNGDTASALINSAWIGVGNALWTYCAAALTDFENQPTERTHTLSQVFKTSLFRIINTYFSLFYIAAGLGQFVSVGDLNDSCSKAGSSCLDDLYAQLGIQMSVNWASLSVFFHLLPIYLPALLAFFQGAKASALTAASKRAIAEGVARVRSGARNTCSAGDLWLRVREESVSRAFDEGPFFMIQLLNVGYVMLFSPAFSLAPIIAMALNALSTVMDLGAALRHSARPLPQSATDTGAWLLMFELLAFLCVLTNSLVISVPTTQPLFTAPSSVGSWNSPMARMGWFICASCTLFTFKYMCVLRACRLQEPQRRAPGLLTTVATPPCKPTSPPPNTHTHTHARANAAAPPSCPMTPQRRSCRSGGTSTLSTSTLMGGLTLWSRAKLRMSNFFYFLPCTVYLFNI